MAPHSAALEIAEASNVTGARSGYREQQLTPMAQGGHSKRFKVLVVQVSQDGKVDVILSKALSVLPETELPKPVRNLLHRGSRGFVVALADSWSPRPPFLCAPSKQKAPVRYAGLLERKASGVRGWGLAFRSPRQCTGPIYRSLQS